MKDLSRYESYIGHQIEGATTDGEKLTDVYLEGDKVFCVIDNEYEAEFDCVVLNLNNGGAYVRIK
ncbi:MAG TPA: hypothetical protein VL946_06505 [Lacibacter sp.]|nr:hypothetical protein [Lacibacter sp.]